MTSGEFKAEVRILLTERELGVIIGSREGASSRLAASKQHLASADQVIDFDPEAAVQLAYDSARKILDATLMAVGLRVHQRGGSHTSYIKVATSKIFNQEVWSDLVWMRKLRNHAEYLDEKQLPISQTQAREALQAARLMVVDGERVLVELLSQKAPASPQPKQP